MLKNDGVKLAVSFAVTFAAAAIGSIGSAGAPEFYRALTAPPWAPPAWLFGPVWTTLYALMAVAAWLVWRRAGRQASGPLAIYGAQLALNALWSWLFFRGRMGGLALLDIAILWLAIVGTIAVFARYSRVAAWLLSPYLLWVTYAAALTAALWRSNPGVL